MARFQMRQRAPGAILIGAVVWGGLAARVSGREAGRIQAEAGEGEASHRERDMLLASPQPAPASKPGAAPAGGKGSPSGGGSSSGAGGGGALPEWLTKPPYWLPTPPEWGPPPAHIFSSFYAPQAIPQVRCWCHAALLSHPTRLFVHPDSLGRI